MKKKILGNMLTVYYSIVIPNIVILLIMSFNEYNVFMSSYYL